MGKERDDENGLYYHGARHYAPWLGRWINADPAGLKDRLNLFAFMQGNPISYSDPTGNEKNDTAAELNQRPVDYALTKTEQTTKDNPEGFNRKNPGAPSNEHHEIIDTWINENKKTAPPGSAAARTNHNIAIRRIPGTETGEVLSIGGGVVTTAPGKPLLKEGQIISFGELEHVGEHKSGGRVVKTEPRRWGQTAGTYKGPVDRGTKFCGADPRTIPRKDATVDFLCGKTFVWEDATFGLWKWNEFWAKWRTRHRTKAEQSAL
jgi:RHS repeat-associated protein